MATFSHLVGVVHTYSKEINVIAKSMYTTCDIYRMLCVAHLPPSGDSLVDTIQ